MAKESKAKTAVADVPHFKAPDPEKSAAPAKRVPAFYIGEVEYTALAEPTADIALTYMEIGASDRPFAILSANAYLMNAVLGPDNYAILKQTLAQTDEGLGELTKLLEAMQRRVFAALDPKATSQPDKPSGDNTDG